MALTKINDRGLKTPIDLLDNEKIRFGDATTPDLEIYHDGSHSYITDTGTGAIKLKGDDVRLENASGNNIVKVDGSVAELFYNGNKKLETTNAGGTLTGDWLLTSGGYLSFPDNVKAFFGTSSDLQIYHDGSTNIIDGRYHPIELRHQAEVHIKCVDDGAVELYHNNIKTIATSANGATFTGADGYSCELYISADRGDDNADKWRINALSSGSVFQIGNYNNGSGWETSIECNGDNNVELYYDGDRKLATYSGGITVYGDESANSTIQFYADEGDDNADLWLAQATTGGEFKIQNYASGSWEKNIECNGNGNVELYYDGSTDPKLKTSSYGVQISGTNLNMNSTYIDFSGDVSTPSTAAAIYRPADNNLAFSTANTERLLLDENGNVGIGAITGDVDRLLHLESGSCFMRFTNPATSTSNGDIMGMIEFEHKDSNTPGIAANLRSEMVDTSNGACSLFFSAGTPSTIATRMEVQSGGDVKINDGNLVIGTSGHGIDFSSAASGNSPTSSLLDDYEYGSFTPTIRGSTGAGTRAYSAQNGWYCKIGRLVYVSMDFTVSSWSGATGSQQITDLPFNKNELSGVGYYYEGVTTWYVADEMTSTQSNYGGYIPDNNNYLAMYVGDTPEIGTGAPVNVTGRIAIQVTYSTSS